MKTEGKLRNWRASLFPLGSFAYFCCQKYREEYVCDLDTDFRRYDGLYWIPFYNSMTKKIPTVRWGFLLCTLFNIWDKSMC